MNSNKSLAIGLTVAALGVAALAPSAASARDATGRLHFHPFTFVDVRAASVDAADAAASTDAIDRVVCPVRQVLTPQGARLLQACD